MNGLFALSGLLYKCIFRLVPMGQNEDKTYVIIPDHMGIVVLRLMIFECSFEAQLTSIHSTAAEYVFVAPSLYSHMPMSGLILASPTIGRIIPSTIKSYKHLGRPLPIF